MTFAKIYVIIITQGEVPNCCHKKGETLMKKRIILLTAILSVLMLFTSCVRTVPVNTQAKSSESINVPYEPRPVPDFQRAWEYCIYNDYLFAKVGNTIKYQKLNNIQDSGFSLSDKSTDNSSGNLGIFGHFMKFLVDVDATNNNNGSPVLIITHSESLFDIITKKSKLVSTILLFNTATQKLETIQSNIPESIWDMVLYKDYIFYVTQEADNGLVIHRINKDGTGYQRMESDAPHRYRIATVHEDKLYFYADDFKEIYRCDLNFKNTERLFEITGSEMIPFAHGEYIYYCKVNRNITIRDVTYRSPDLYRRKISDWENSEELLFKNAYASRTYGDIMIYYLYDDMTGDHKNTYEFNVLNAYDLANSKNLGCIYINDDHSFDRQCEYLGDGYGCGKYCTFDIKTKKYYIDQNKTFLINIETGEETIIQW